MESMRLVRNKISTVAFARKPFRLWHHYRRRRGPGASLSLNHGQLLAAQDSMDSEMNAIGEVVARQATTTQHEPEYSSVICKLSRLCKLPSLVNEIKRTCIMMKQVQHEGMHVANLNLLRCLSKGDQLPRISMKYYYQCCTSVVKKIEERDSSSPTPRFPHLQETLLSYWTVRRYEQNEGHYEPVDVVNAGAMIAEMAKVMSINALNMIATQFRRRLRQYCQFRYARNGQTKLSRKETNKLVQSCYQVKTRTVIDSDGNETVKKIWNVWVDTTDPIELELRAWLGMVPWGWTIRRFSTHFICKLFDMLAWMECFVSIHPRVPGTKLYSLLPLPNSYSADYVKINGSTLYGIFSRIMVDPEVKEFLRSELNIVPTDELPKGTDHTFSAFTRKTFIKRRSEILRKVFHVTKFETMSRSFANQVTTNGYGAIILLTRQAAASTEMTGNNVSQAHGKLKNNDRFGKELLKLGPGYSPDVLVGIDPGKKTLCTAVSVGCLPPLPKIRKGRQLHMRRNRRKRRKRRRQQKRRMPMTTRGKHAHGTQDSDNEQHPMGKPRKTQILGEPTDQTIIQISTQEYRHMARMTAFQSWHEDLKARESTYADILEEMPSFKTSGYIVYFMHLEFLLKNLRFLLRFSTEQPFLKWRFTRDRLKSKALDALAKRIVPVPSTQVCVAYGDWSRQAGIKGHPPAPVKGFAKALMKRATVLPMDEFRTSQLCSCCHHRLKKARLFTKIRRREGEDEMRKVGPLTKSEYLKECKENAEMAKWQKPRLLKYKCELKSNWSVLRCTNSQCKINFYNRDVNAAWNILELLKSGLRGEHGPRRPEPFRRGG